MPTIYGNPVSKRCNVTFFKGIPTTAHLDKWFKKTNGGVLVLDDLMEEGGRDKSVLDLFTKDSHHRNITVFYLAQDIRNDSLILFFRRRFLSDPHHHCEVIDHHCEVIDHHCEVMIPPGHFRTRDTTPLSKERIDSVEWMTELAARRLNKNVMNPMTKKLLARNAVLVQEVSQLLAFGWLSDDNIHVMGGTGWAVQMAKDKGTPVFLFELKYSDWMLWRGDQQQWVQCEGMNEENVLPPTLCQNTGIVGTREPTNEVLPELERLFQQYRNLH